MSKDINNLKPAAPRMWFQLGRDQREIVAGVIINGEARWLKGARPAWLCDLQRSLPA